MANTFLTTQLISKTALAMFSINSPFIMTGSRNYQAEFSDTGYKIGNSINVRRQVQYIAGDGPTAQSQSILETDETITINHQYHTMIEYNMSDLTLKIDDFSRIFLQPAIQTIIAKMEGDIATAAEQQLYIYTGTAGTPINSFASVDRAGTKMLGAGIDLSGDVYQAMSLQDAQTLKASFPNGFTPAFNEDIVRNSSLGHVSYFDVFQSQLIKKHVAGLGPTTYATDTLTTSGDVGSGNTITITGATGSVTNYFLPGDRIQIAGTNSVSPLGRIDTGENIQFVITAAANSGSGTFTVTVAPAIISDISNPLRNVTNAILSGSAITTVGNHRVNVAYIPRAIDIVCPPLAKLQVPYWSRATDPKTKLSLTLTQAGDIVSYNNFMRLDILCGFQWHPQYAVVNLS
jgi:hypothetical protein